MRADGKNCILPAGDFESDKIFRHITESIDDITQHIIPFADFSVIVSRHGDKRPGILSVLDLRSERQKFLAEERKILIDFFYIGVYRKSNNEYRPFEFDDSGIVLFVFSPQISE